MLSAESQVKVGTIIANAMDGALKKIFLDLASASARPVVAGEEKIAVNIHPLLSQLDADAINALQEVVDSGELQEFLISYSGIGYNMDFLPLLPTLTVTQQKDVAKIALGASASPHILGGEISIGISGKWSF